MVWFCLFLCASGLIASLYFYLRENLISLDAVRTLSLFVTVYSFGSTLGYVSRWPYELFFFFDSHQQLLGDSALFMHCLCTVHEKNKIKMGLTVLFTNLKIILLQYFQFSVSAKISCIRTDPVSFKPFFRVLKLFNFLCPIVLPLFLSPCPRIASLFLCFFPRFLVASLSSITSLFLFPCMLSF